MKLDSPSVFICPDTEEFRNKNKKSLFVTKLLKKIVKKIKRKRRDRKKGSKKKYKSQDKKRGNKKKKKRKIKRKDVGKLEDADNWKDVEM